MILAASYGPGPLGPYGSGPFIIWKNFSKSNMLQDHIWNAHCSIMKEHVCYMLLEQYAFQILSWSTFNLEIFFNLTIQDHKVPMVQDHMVLDHKSRLKCQKKKKKKKAKPRVTNVQNGLKLTKITNIAGSGGVKFSNIALNSAKVTVTWRQPWEI